MGSRKRAVTGLASQAVSARVTKHFFTILVKHAIMAYISVLCYFNINFIMTGLKPHIQLFMSFGIFVQDILFR